MTLSDETRSSAVETALGRMLEDLGGAGLDGMRFSIGAERYVDLPVTTWLELEALGYVRADHNFGDPGYRLTGQGWIAALKSAGRLESDGLRTEAARLRAALKDVVKGRELHGAATDLYELSALTGSPADWIFNALESRLLARLWPRDHLDVEVLYGGRHIRVPARFGMKRLDGLEAGPFADP